MNRFVEEASPSPGAGEHAVSTQNWTVSTSENALTSRVAVLM